jgi:protein-S-isoprenylcysteine O-methyltransferase Ste14
MAKRLVRCFLVLGAIASILAALQGSFDGWLMAYCAGWLLFGLYAMVSIDDELARERFQPPEPGADRLSLRAVRLIALAHLVVGALDAGRWHLAPVSSPVRACALVAMVGGGFVIVRAMRANRFFSPVVRIQSERGHQVIDRGPYATIRHPGYLGMFIAVPSSGLALGSWLSFAIAMVYAVLIVKRVRFEDAFLKANLSGYREYASRVAYRLIPGAW